MTAAGLPVDPGDHGGPTPDPRAVWESLTPAQREWLQKMADPTLQPRSETAIRACDVLADVGLIDVNWDDLTDLGRAVAKAGQEVSRG